jgi:hypothetical protein
MSGYGFSLKWLVTAVTLTAFGLTALFNASQVWESVIGLATVVFLLTTVVAAVCSGGKRRAFWIGCLVFAWGYLFIADNPFRDNVQHPTLLTHVALDALHDLLNEDLSAVLERERARRIADAVAQRYRPGQRGRTIRDLSRNRIRFLQGEYAQAQSSTRRIGHYVFAWIFAAVGGFVGSYFYARRERTS